MRTEAATFVVFDTETTGVVPATDRIIEIAAVKLRGGQVVERFASLVHPGRVVPARITEITGITTGTLIGAPPVADVLPGFLAFAEGAVLVGHNVAFDVGFVNAELARMGQPPLLHPTVCTVRLARRLLPGLRSKNLGAVAEHLGIPVTARHRAAGDAEATAAAFVEFVRRIGPAAETVAGLVAYQHTKYDAKRAPAHVSGLREKVAAAPERPGVYFFHDANGAVVYVGKAKRLRQRLRSYVTAFEAKPARLRQLVETVRDVTWEETGSELAALLLESRLIKERQPRFNRASRRYKTRPFVRLETTPYPRVSVSTHLFDDGAEYFGPLGGRHQAEVVVELVNRFFGLRECDDPTFAHGRACLYASMGRCLAPCESDDAPTYAAEVERVRAFLLGHDDHVLDAVRTAMREAAGRREYELAGTYRDWAAVLERMTDRGRRVAAPVLDHHAVVVQDGVVPGMVDLFAVRFGRLAGQLTLAATPDAADLDRLDAFLAAWFGDDVPRPERYLRPEIDEVRLLAHWLYVYRDSARHVHAVPGEGPAALGHRVRAALGALEDAEAFEEV